MPTSIGERSAKGTSLVANSQRRMAKLHMSLASRLISLGFFCRAGNILLIFTITKNNTKRKAG